MPILNKVVNVVSMEESHHKHMGMNGGSLLKFALKDT